MLLDMFRKCVVLSSLNVLDGLGRLGGSEVWVTATTCTQHHTLPFSTLLYLLTIFIYLIRTPTLIIRSK